MKGLRTEKLLQKVNNSHHLALFLHVLCYLCTVFCIFVFGYMFLHFLLLSWTSVLCFCLILAIPFVIVSLVRYFVNAPRPYEIYEFYVSKPKSKQGQSFPSRHAFSAFAIGTLCMLVNPVVGAITLLFGAVMCFCRVALGIHFIRDVLCGAIIGAVSSIIGIFILL